MKTTKHIIHALCCAALTLIPLAQAQPSASGRILDDDGKPVSNPFIFLLPQQQSGPANPQKADSRADGLSGYMGCGVRTHGDPAFGVVIKAVA